MNTPPEVSTIPIRPAGSGTPGARGRRARLIENWAHLLIFAAGVVTLGLFLGLHISNSYRGEMAYWRARQISVADERAQRVEDWLQERQADSELFSTLPSVRATLQAHLTPGSLARGPDRLPLGLPAALDLMARQHTYAGAYILDRDIQIVAQSSGAITFTPALADACRKALRAGTFRIELLGDTPGKTIIALTAPVFSEPGRARKVL